MELQHQGFGVNRECDVLTKTARVIGTAAGYYQRSSREELIADAERLLRRSPERALMIAGAIGLMLGAIVRPRSAH